MSPHRLSLLPIDGEMLPALEGDGAIFEERHQAEVGEAAEFLREVV